MFCRRVITKEQLEEADSLIMQYCVKYVEIYGKECCTPNLHLHGYLANCIRDYGPVYAFWLFSFERLNGVLGSYHLLFLSKSCDTLTTAKPMEHKIGQMNIRKHFFPCFLVQITVEVL